MSEEAKKFIQDLRALAYLYEKHPELEVPYVGNFNAFVTREKLVDTAKTIAYLKPKKDYADTWFNLAIPFETFELHFSIEREKVCERVRVGTKIVEVPAREAHTEEIPQYEWKCPEAILR